MAGIETVQAYCGWHIAPSISQTIEAEGGGGRVLLLPSLHVTAVAEVRDESGSVVTGVKVRRNGVARGLWRRHELYEFDVTHGHDTMPDEVQEIIYDLDERPIGSAYVQVGQVRVATDKDGAPLGTGLTSGQKAILDRYKLPPRP